MTILKKGLYFTILLLCLGFLQESSGGKLYKWTDEDGVVHFSDRKPGENDKYMDTMEEEDLLEISPLKKETHEKVESQTRSPIEFATRCTFTIKNGKSIGTGFFISPNGYAITCRHVIEEGHDHIAVLNDSKEFSIGIISSSERHDIALIMVMTPQPTDYLSIRKDGSLVPGERVFAIGSSVGLHSTVTDGVFTGYRKMENSLENVIQFSAPVNPGNSGGPLIASDGNVAGIVSWKIVSKKGVPVTGVSFAVPASYVEEEYGMYLE